MESNETAETFDLRKLADNTWSRVKALGLIALGLGFLSFPIWWILTQVVPRWGASIQSATGLLLAGSLVFLYFPVVGGIWMVRVGHRWLGSQPVELAVDARGLALRDQAGRSILIEWSPELADFIPPARSGDVQGDSVTLILPAREPFAVPEQALARIRLHLSKGVKWDRNPRVAPGVLNSGSSQRFDVRENDSRFRKKSRDRPIAYMLIAGLTFTAGPLVVFRLIPSLGVAVMALIGVSILGTWLVAQGVGEVRLRLLSVELSSQSVVLGTTQGSLRVEWGKPPLEIDLYDYRDRPKSRLSSLPCGLRVRTRTKHFIAGISGEAFDSMSAVAESARSVRITRRENEACRWLEIRDAESGYAAS